MADTEDSREKRRAHDRARYAANREALCRKVSDYQKANRGKINARVRERYADNPEKTLERNRRQRAKNPEKVRKQARQTSQRWRDKNLEKVREASRIYRDTARGAYNSQRRGAKVRGVAFLLTFEEWWAIWTDSGKWEQRGRLKDQYVMARYGDQGPYAVGNVRICLTGDNVREALPMRTPLSEGARGRIGAAMKRYWEHYRATCTVERAPVSDTDTSQQLPSGAINIMEE